MENIESQIQAINERNKRVEAEKAWEVSWFRRISIAVLTYVTATVFLILIGNERPWFNAIVPPIAYILSTLSLPPLRRWWMGNNN